MNIFVFNRCYAGDASSIKALIERILPGKSSQFKVHYIHSNKGKDCYQIESDNQSIILSGNNNVSISVALNEYLRLFCHTGISWTGNIPVWKGTLPRVAEKIKCTSPFAYRYYLNYCTFSYSMAFWDWKRWEKEIDWMAMHGINLPLAIVGQEAVWQNTLRKYGFIEDEIKSFISGPAFNAWWLMGNLEAWGGPVPQSWIDGQSKLQKKIIARMRSLDMQPVLQGFYGMVPNSLTRKYPNAKIHDPGKWLGFRRPAMLLPTDSLFVKMARTYYNEQTRLYGHVKFFQGDPFHEGGNAEGMDLKAAGTAIYHSMEDHQPGAVWVLQSWQSNPFAELLSGIPKGRALVVNIMAEAKPQWGGRTKYWPERKDGFSGHDWIWSEIPNFGGRTGMTAKLDSTALDIFEALHHPIGIQGMKGIGATPEGIGQDEIIYDLIFDLGWTSKKLNLDQWLKKYVVYRYGSYDEDLFNAWQILRKTVYASNYGKKDPPVESILCSRPGWNRTSASTWGMGEPNYDPAELHKAWILFIHAQIRFQNNDRFCYDLVNLTRQILSNYGRTLYHRMQSSFEAKNVNEFTETSSAFLALIKDQDRLLSTRSEFMLGHWLTQAKNKGTNSFEKSFYEWNARTLITTWTHELNDVNDYACREWGGLLKDYYLIRWQKFVAYSVSVLQGGKSTEPDYFSFEKNWTLEHKTYPDVPGETVQEVIRYLKNKYTSVLSEGEGFINYQIKELKYQGRIDRKSKVDCAVLFWAGSSVTMSFTGESVQALLKDQKGDNYYAVILDQRYFKKIKLDSGKHFYNLADQLSNGRHSLTLFKCTQWDKGNTFFYGFLLPNKHSICKVPTLSNRKIEFYGNSITCGSAVEDSSGHDSGASQFENNYLSYASITANHYHADYSCIARSGIGLMVSWYPLIMPEMYDRLDPENPKSKWDFSRFIPDIVVVNLFQNDAWILKLKENPQFKKRFGNKEPSKDFIIDSYQKFIRSIRLQYPIAKIICVLGNMDAVAPGSPWPDYIEQAVNLLHDGKVYAHFFSYKQSPGHPNVQEQSEMADNLIKFIDENILW